MAASNFSVYQYSAASKVSDRHGCDGDEDVSNIVLYYMYVHVFITETFLHYILIVIFKSHVHAGIGGEWKLEVV